MLVDSYNFGELLEKSVKVHGHMCPGQVIGVRMSMLGLNLIGISEPHGADRKKLIVFVEIDRCATDAIQSVTGCTLGHRTMKFYDYGKMAATFYNIETKKAVRILAKEEAKEIAKATYMEPHTESSILNSSSGSKVDKYTAQLHAYKEMPYDELFSWKEVKNILLQPHDMPGRPLTRVKCSICGEFVQDNKHFETDRVITCKSCTLPTYYTY